LNLVFPNNNLSHKHIKMIIYKNNFIFKNNYTNQHKPYKITTNVNDFIIDSIKNNYVYKKTTVNINPYTFEEQKNQLTTIYEHLVNDSNLIKLKTNNQLNNIKNDILNENK